MTGPTAARLPGDRLHFQHGPIDLIVEARGPHAEVTAAHRQAWAAFSPVLDDLVAVLPLLRTPVARLLHAEPSFSSDGETTGDRPPSLPSTAGLTVTGGDRPRVGAKAPASCRRHAYRRDVGGRALPVLAHGLEPFGNLPDGSGVGPKSGMAPASRPGRSADVASTPGPQPGQREQRASCRSAFAPGSVAAAMLAATAPHGQTFVTPMAAVAGAVADHVLAAMTAGRRLSRAYVNNGGDAALWLAPGAEITAAGGPALADRIRVRHADPVRGIATSGWRGRSHSLGIADAVTVLAATAAGADVAATLIANAVDLPDHPAIRRRPASELDPDSDLGARPVTVSVGPLTRQEIARAVSAGERAARTMLSRGLILGAAIWLGPVCRSVGATPPSLSSGHDRAPPGDAA